MIKTKQAFQVILIIICSSIFAINLLAAQGSIDVGPKIGSLLPELVVVDQSAQKKQLEQIIGEKGAIIVLFRSADWCPFCKTHLLELNEQANEFKKHGFGVVAISYDSPKVIKAFSMENQLNFMLLSDQNVATFKSFNVVNTMYQPGSRHYGIPYPGVIVVNSTGKVVEKYFYEGYKKRVQFKQLLNDLKD